MPQERATHVGSLAKALPPMSPFCFSSQLLLSTFPYCFSFLHFLTVSSFCISLLFLLFAFPSCFSFLLLSNMPPEWLPTPARFPFPHSCHFHGHTKVWCFGLCLRSYCFHGHDITSPGHAHPSFMSFRLHGHIRAYWCAPCLRLYCFYDHHTPTCSCTCILYVFPLLWLHQGLLLYRLSSSCRSYIYDTSLHVYPQNSFISSRFHGHIMACWCIPCLRSCCFDGHDASLLWVICYLISFRCSFKLHATHKGMRLHYVLWCLSTYVCWKGGVQLGVEVNDIQDV